MSIQHKFDGKLRRQKKHTQDFTSLSLFRDELECLLRDLYGDVESEALDSIVRAVFRIVEAFTKYVRPDLCKEHHDAEDLDYMFGIGIARRIWAPALGKRRGMVAEHDLMLRVREVRENPSAFSAYTGEFAAWFGVRCGTAARSSGRGISRSKGPQTTILVTVDSQRVAATDIETRP